MITGSESIVPCKFRQTGNRTFRIATPNDLQMNQYLVDNIGLTKREYFAVTAMQGLLANNFIASEEDFAKRAISMADALIIELNKTETNE